MNLLYSNLNMGRKRYYFVFVLCIVMPFLMWSQMTYRNRLDSAILEMGSNTVADINPHNIILPASNSSTSTTESAIKSKDFIYILIWTKKDRDPLKYLLSGSKAFKDRKCPVQNCFITNEIFKNLTDFDVILFNGPEVVDKKNPKLPRERSPTQNYVFAAIESSGNYPICDKRFDGYFNISWTYKLNSDIPYGYLIVRNSTGDIIGPKKEMHWMSIEEMKPINETIKKKLSSKNKLAAWIVSNCNALSGRDTFTRKFQYELKKMRSDMTVDVYGSCGRKKCGRNRMAQCLQLIEKDYYFYFSFENSFSEDYVTEKLLHGLQHFTVPVVFGTANYSRFMPEGSYLNAKELGPQLLAKKMLELVNDKEAYYSYFKWMNHYSFHNLEESPETDFYCKFCEAMNDESLMRRVTVIENFYEWWNPPVISRGLCPARL